MHQIKWLVNSVFWIHLPYFRPIWKTNKIKSLRLWSVHERIFFQRFLQMLMSFFDEFVRINLLDPKSEFRGFLFVDFNIPSSASIQRVQCPFWEEFLQLLDRETDFDSSIENHVFLFWILEAPSYFPGLYDGGVNVFLPSFSDFPRVIDFHFGCQILPIEDLLVDDEFLEQLVLGFFPVVRKRVGLFRGIDRRILLNDTSIFVVELRLLFLILHFWLLIDWHFLDNWRLFFVASHVLSNFPPFLLLLLLLVLDFGLVPWLFFWQGSLALPMGWFVPWSFSLFFRILLSLSLPLFIAILFALFWHLVLFKS